MKRVLVQAWILIKESVTGFINDNALSHGAAMARRHRWRRSC
jgi:membrane protein